MSKKINAESIILIYIFSFQIITATIIKEGYHFFDIFYYKDMYKNFVTQKNNNKCSIDEGPNCYYTPKNASLIVHDLKSIFPKSYSFLKE